MFEFSKRVKEAIFLMSFDEFCEHWLTILSMLEFSKRLKGILLMSFDEFSNHWATILSMFDFSKRVKETIFF